MAASYISERAGNEANSDASQILSSIKDLHQRKLWHQLTENVKKAVTMESVSDKCALYTRFLKEFEDKLNAVSLVQVVITAARAELSHSPADALAFISPLLSENATKTIASDIEAKVLLLSEVAELHLRAEDTASCKTNIRSAREIVDAGHELSAAVHAAFYRAAAEYHKVVGSAADFFRAALQFLAYTPPDALDLAAQRQWAFDLGIAALVGADVYNFGELLAHNVVRSLEGSAHAWLLRLLCAFHEGDLKKFDDVCESATQEMNAQPALVAHPEFLRQKVTILALMQLATAKSGTRIISFAEVREVCRLPEEEVEFLLMRAMSLGLITGVIDNVAEEVTISRVQPRVVDRECVAEMAKRLEAWCGNVDETLNSVSRGAITIGE